VLAKNASYLMTISIALKVGDGIVLGADSATLVTTRRGEPNTYFNAEKLFNLVKGLPLGFVAAGLGGIGGRSVTSHAKDLRARLKDNSLTEWWLDPTSYTVELAAQRMRKFFYEELYEPAFRSWSAEHPEPPELAFLVGGYSAGQGQGEIWELRISRTGATVECVIDRNNPGDVIWIGQPEALNRLIRGYSSEVFDGLVDAGVDPQAASNFLYGLSVESLVHPAMPIQDAIDFVHYLVDVTAGFVRFVPGHATVHPPTDSAAITKHEGFRWVTRKHYFNAELNRAIDQYAVQAP
jgi:hypothetical protein